MSDAMNSVTEPQEKFLRLAVGQVKPSKPKCMLSSLTQLRNLAIEAKNSNSDVLILPELFLGGGYILHDIDKLAITSQSSEMKEAQKVAKESGVSLIFGYAETSGDLDKTIGSDTCVTFNSSVCIEGRSGNILHNYRKTHLFGNDEKRAFVPGNDLGCVFNLMNRKKEMFRASLLICYDIEFPEAARKCALNGAEILFVPTANMIPYCKINNIVVPARAIENHVSLVYCNWTSYTTSEKVELNGESSVISKGGNFIHKVNRYDNGIQIVDLSMKCNSNGIIKETENSYYSNEAEENYLSNRRPELYA